MAPRTVTRQQEHTPEDFKQDSTERWAWAQVAEDADARGDLYQTRPGTLTAGTTRTCRDGSYQDHLLPSLFTGKKDCAGTVLRGEFQRGDARDLKTAKRPLLAHKLTAAGLVGCPLLRRLPTGRTVSPPDFGWLVDIN